MNQPDIKKLVKEKYAEAALEVAAGSRGDCCDRRSTAFRDCESITGDLYAADELGAVPQAAA
ncbi:MAG: hypothetical protein AB7I32_12725, partial [Gammaproteobacteria bacterium]